MPKSITVLQIIQTIILKMNQESEYQVRPISFFFLIIQKSVKNCIENSLKKLTFATLRRTNFESVFRKFEVIAFFYKVVYRQRKNRLFSKKGCRLPT